MVESLEELLEWALYKEKIGKISFEDQMILCDALRKVVGGPAIEDQKLASGETHIRTFIGSHAYDSEDAAFDTEKFCHLSAAHELTDLFGGAEDVGAENNTRMAIAERVGWDLVDDATKAWTSSNEMKQLFKALVQHAQNERSADASSDNASR